MTLLLFGLLLSAQALERPSVAECVVAETCQACRDMNCLWQEELLPGKKCSSWCKMLTKTCYGWGEDKEATCPGEEPRVQIVETPIVCSSLSCSQCNLSECGWTGRSCVDKSICGDCGPCEVPIEGGGRTPIADRVSNPPTRQRRVSSAPSRQRAEPARTPRPQSTEAPQPQNTRTPIVPASTIKSVEVGADARCQSSDCVSCTSQTDDCKWIPSEGRCMHSEGGCPEGLNCLANSKRCPPSLSPTPAPTQVGPTQKFRKRKAGKGKGPNTPSAAPCTPQSCPEAPLFRIRHGNVCLQRPPTWKGLAGKAVFVVCAGTTDQAFRMTRTGQTWTFGDETICLTSDWSLMECSDNSFFTVKEASTLGAYQLLPLKQKNKCMHADIKGDDRVLTLKQCEERPQMLFQLEPLL